ncbi:putative Rossmann fold nucleotide-binding protein DprA/Smf involved in DNA uptake [Pseudomonas lurida]
MNPINCHEISPSELEARLRLHRLPELGPKRFRLLIEAFGSASKALSAPASAWRSLGVPAISADARRSHEVREGARSALAWLACPGQHLLMWDQPEYPALLAQIDDAPPLLFVAGDPLILEKPQLAMVGSRRATRPGMDTAAAFSRSLASAGFVITTRPGLRHRRRSSSSRIGRGRPDNRGTRHRAGKFLSTASHTPGGGDD